jgi:hypothetical protein
LGVFEKSQIDYLIENVKKSGISFADGLVAFIKAFEQV